MLFLTCGVSFIAQLALVYIPLMQGIFKTEALGMRDFLTVLGFGLVSMTLHEGRRMYERKLNAELDRADGNRYEEGRP
jgi:Ca2+-transporting ATPase